MTSLCATEARDRSNRIHSGIRSSLRERLRRGFTDDGTPQFHRHAICVMQAESCTLVTTMGLFLLAHFLIATVVGTPLSESFATQRSSLAGSTVRFMSTFQNAKSSQPNWN